MGDRRKVIAGEPEWKLPPEVWGNILSRLILDGKPPPLISKDSHEGFMAIKEVPAPLNVMEKSTGGERPPKRIPCFVEQLTVIPKSTSSLEPPESELPSVKKMRFVSSDISNIPAKFLESFPNMNIMAVESDIRTRYYRLVPLFCEFPRGLIELSVRDRLYGNWMDSVPPRLERLEIENLHQDRNVMLSKLPAALEALAGTLRRLSLSKLDIPAESPAWGAILGLRKLEELVMYSGPPDMSDLPPALTGLTLLRFDGNALPQGISSLRIDRSNVLPPLVTDGLKGLGELRFGEQITSELFYEHLHLVTSLPGLGALEFRMPESRQDAGPERFMFLQQRKLQELSLTAVRDWHHELLPQQTLARRAVVHCYEGANFRKLLPKLSREDLEQIQLRGCLGSLNEVVTAFVAFQSGARICPDFELSLPRLGLRTSDMGALAGLKLKTVIYVSPDDMYESCSDRKELGEMVAYARRFMKRVTFRQSADSSPF